jgi:hypothetical protein
MKRLLITLLFLTACKEDGPIPLPVANTIFSAAPLVVPWPFFMDEMSAGMQTYGMAS